MLGIMLGPPASKSLWPFSPQSIPGLSLWLDAADTVTITGTSPVTVWKDKSGKGNNATNSGGDGPSYANNTMTFSGYNDRLYISVPYNYAISGGTIVFVGKPLSYSVWNSWRTLIRGANSDHQVILYYDNNNIGSYSQGNGFQQYGTYTNDGSFTMLMFVNISTSSLFSASMNGDITLSSTANPTPDTADTYYGLGNYQGGSQPWGDLNEIIIYNSALTTVQRQQLEGYLAQKWELQSNLPATHPYYATSAMQLYKQPVFQRTFSPIDIPGCSLWLDAADLSTITGTSTVTAWKDKSGNGYNATATGTPTLSTAGGFNSSYRTIYLDGSSWFLGSVNISSTTSLTAFVVTSFALSSSASSARVLGLASAGQADWNNAPSSDTFYQDYGTSNLSTYRNGVYLSAAVGQNTPVIGSCVYDGISNYLYKNGASQTPVESTGEFAISIYGIGNQPILLGETLNGYIGEVIVFNTALTSSQRQQVESYLAWKWGLVSSLASGHPGKLLPSFSTTFTPKSISGLTLWMDAEDKSSITFSSGTTVSAWSDKSGNQNTFTTVAGTLTYTTTTIGNPGIYIPTGAGMTSANNTAVNGNTSRTYFFVADVPTGTRAHIGTGSIPGGGSPPNTFGFDSVKNYNVIWCPYVYTAADIIFTSVAATTTINYAAYNSDTSNLYGNYNTTPPDTIVSTTLNTTPNIWYLGNRPDGATVGNAYICEFIEFNTYLTTSQRQQVEGYLAWKWGLQNNLPDTHAYKKIKP